MKSETLAYLTSGDWQALESIAIRKLFATGENIIVEGHSVRNLFILRRGYVQVEREYQGQGIALSQLGAGAVFGEMSLLEQTGASASVTAASEVEVDVIEELSLRSLLNSLPGFSSRFYQSLAVTLSQRLRNVSEQLSQRHDQSQRPTRIGNISERQIPLILVDAVEQFKQTMTQLEQQIKQRQVTSIQAQTQTNDACNQLMNALSHHSQGEALIDSAWSNLLAFRDLDQLESGIGDYVFRELFPVMMQSASIAYCHTRPRGLIDGYETNQLIYANEAEGDGWLGPFIDGWFLSTHFCQSRQQGRQHLAQLLQHYSQQPSTSILSLGSGTAFELLDVLPKIPSLHVTLIDQDLVALHKTRQVAEKLGCAGSITLIQNDVLLLAKGQEKLTLPPQKFIYSFGLLDYLTDEQLILILQWIATQLAEQGTVLLTNISPEHPDRLLIKHILEWSPYYRTSSELKEFLVSAGLSPIQLSEVKTTGISWVMGRQESSE
ncbi:cyclic nucleotide-binding domain-containing protein [Synechococcus sp. PCC 6312]|uniref:cyclic nucleotide-binding domain-containing protein n=1 Tax=Synechococcus sp. (strain ATCC 27167 / PCC 6312) TaxID=195253 RepID=UPI00029EE480|nr:cyclic nucleotide-binding domain-containing protein [Synechococcus sp. PCC 6312]AFY62138.1 cAMP-binding protein [Synechococcus sp. PCC 6312]